jgi:hypothetical protein
VHQSDQLHSAPSQAPGAVTGCLGVPVQFYPGSSPSIRISDRHGPAHIFPSPEPSQGPWLIHCIPPVQPSTPLHHLIPSAHCPHSLVLPGPYLLPGTAWHPCLQPTQYGSICLPPMLPHPFRSFQLVLQQLGFDLQSKNCECLPWLQTAANRPMAMPNVQLLHYTIKVYEPLWCRFWSSY